MSVMLDGLNDDLLRLTMLDTLNVLVMVATHLLLLDLMMMLMMTRLLLLLLMVLMLVVVTIVVDVVTTVMHLAWRHVVDHLLGLNDILSLLWADDIVDDVVSRLARRMIACYRLDRRWILNYLLLEHLRLLRRLVGRRWAHE